MRKGALIYDDKMNRMDIRFTLYEYYGGLHCGECFDILDNDKWKPTRLEYNNGWYLVGVNQNINLQGLIVRIND